MSNKVERRLITTEFRAVKEEGKPTRLAGYAAVFNSDSEDLGGFIEQIAPGAFDDVLASKPDTRCLWNHDPSALLGRTKSGTLTLSSDARGLHYDCIAPDTTVGRDVLVLTERGDISQSSFGFVVDSTEGSQRWYDAEGKETGMWRGVRRVIYRVKELFDVSPVCFPAYPDASVEARSKFLFPNGRPDPALCGAVFVNEITAPADKDAVLNKETRKDSQPSLAVNGVGGDKDDCYEEQCFEVQAALNIKFPYEEYYYGGKYCSIETYTDSVIVYDYSANQYYTIAYTEASNDVFEFGDPQPVEEAWVASERAAKFVAELRATVTKAIEQRAADKALAAVPVVVAPVEHRDNEAGCGCDCPECVGNDCDNCSDETCDDANCTSSDAYMSRSLVTRLKLAEAQNF